MDRFLWRLNFDCGRMGSVRGLFVATDSEVSDIMGKSVYFGEVLGKHSEIHGTIDTGEITKVDLDSETVDKVSKVLGTNWSGFNPFDYLEENSEDD